MIPSQIIVFGLVLCLQKVQIYCEKTPRQTTGNSKNDLNDFTSQLQDSLQSIKPNEAETIDDNLEDFDDINDDIETPISDVDFDNLNNALIVKFNKKYHEPLDDSNSNDDNKLIEPSFMRFTRAGHNSLMRFGKRQLESSKDQHSIDSSKASSRYGRSSSTSRDSRGDNFMRFGRSNNNLMRFGRAPATNNMMRFGRAPATNNMMRFGRSNLMRFGRSSPNLMRFGRNDPSRMDSFIRFGRNSNLMRFGRSDPDRMGGFIRFGRSEPGRTDGFIRFGRSPNNLMRFGRTDRNFMRFGKLDQNFMRFGKRDEISSGSHLDSESNNNKTNDNDNIESNNNIGAGWYNPNDEPADNINELLDE